MTHECDYACNHDPIKSVTATLPAAPAPTGKAALQALVDQAQELNMGYGAALTEQAGELPPLPRAVLQEPMGDWFSGTQMQDYARAALAARQAPTEAPKLDQEVSTDIMGAIARGWCAPINAAKVMDPDLAIAIAREVDAVLAARQAPALTINGDAIAKSKHILNLVDDYTQVPNAVNRTKLRKALMDEFEAAGQAPDSRDVTQATTTVPSAK